MRKLERAFAHNLSDFVNAAQEVAPNLRAAAMRCAGGVAAFLGDDSPLTTIKGAGPALTAGDVEAAEEFFRRHGARRACFELAPWVTTEAVDLLIGHGYVPVDSEDVVTQEAPFQDVTPLHPVVSVSAADWPALMLHANESTDSTTWHSLVEVCAVLHGVLRVAVLDDSGDGFSCAELVPAPGVAIFGNDATLESARGRGAQLATIQQRLRYAGALRFGLAAAEVAPGSTSERNYLRCGFGVAYTRVHYARQLD